MTQDPRNAVPRSIQTLCDRQAPFVFDPDYEAVFVAALRDGAKWHAARSGFYGRVLAERSFEPDSLQSFDDCTRLPFVPANVFKTHELLSVPRGDIVLHLTSSGTTGQKSQMFFDAWSLGAGQRMVDWMFQAFGWETSTSRVNYLLYSYESNAKLGTAYTDNYLCKYAPAASLYCGLRRTGKGGHEFDVYGCLERLAAYEASGLPVRIFGFPAFLFFTLNRMCDLELPRLKLSPDSLVMLGGGWKGHADKQVPKRALYELVERQLGIPQTRIRDSFGSVEHAVPYMECERHHFHVPVWSRVLIRDVRTLAPLPAGERGFLQFLTPYITSVPAQSLMMGDLASLHPAAECGCGIQSPFFVVHGRAGTSKNKSCAIAASELLGR